MFVDVTSSYEHVCGLQGDGSVRCAGPTSGSSQYKAIPPAGETFTYLRAGFDQTCGLTATQAVDCWGNPAVTSQVLNNAPIARLDVTTTPPLLEGSTIAFSGATSSDADGDPLSYLWNFTGATQVDGSPTIEAPNATTTSFVYDDNGAKTTTLVVSDGKATNTATVTIQVANVAPTASFIVGATSVPEGTSFQLSLTNPWDPGAADMAAGLGFELNCGSGFAAVVAPGSGATTSTTVATRTCPTTDEGGLSVGGRITDKDGGSTTYPSTGQNAQVTVTNVAPVLAPLSAASLLEGETYTHAGSFTDPGTDNWTVKVNYGDGSPVETLGPGTIRTFALNHRYLQNGSFTVAVTVDDGDGGIDTKSATVTVANVQPVLAATGFSPTPTGPSAAPFNTSVSTTFTDPGLLDTHVVEVDWDEGQGYQTVSGGVQFGGPTNGTGTISLQHAYSQPGVYTVKLRIRDGDMPGFTTAQGFDAATGEQTAQQYVVVYDPAGGFVTGGGWIVSPANACVQISLCGATVEGKATFGFVAKYQKGASTPTGSTEFQYHAGGFEFSSTDYQWLVVAGARAQYKGRGSVKGKAGVYGFLLSAIDGELQGGAKPDRFRIKVWVISSDPALDGQIVYDNGTGADDITSDAQLTALAGGSISIKSK